MIEHERKLMDTLRVASVSVTNKEPVFAAHLRGATGKLMKLKIYRMLLQIIDLIFKTAGEVFNMGRLPSIDARP